MSNLGGTSRDNGSVDLVVGRLAARQHGVFSRAQALAHGMSARQIHRRVSQGRWDSPLPTVFRIVGSGDARQRAMAAALWAGDLALVSHGTAGSLWGVEGVRGAKTELWVPARRNPRSELVVVHRGERLDRADRTMLGPIPITTPIRTLIDVAGRLEDDRLLAAMESVFRRGLGTPERLGARLRALRRGRRPGVGRLADLLAQRGDGRAMESVLEAKVWSLLQTAGVRRPVRQHWVAVDSGRYRLDFAWPDLKVGVECDGWEHHGTRVAFGKDRARFAELAASRWRVLPVTWDVCTRQSERFLRWVRALVPDVA
jgi:very-short-patch-repair endonuclease